MSAANKTKISTEDSLSPVLNRVEGLIGHKIENKDVAIEKSLGLERSSEVSSVSFEAFRRLVKDLSESNIVVIGQDGEPTTVNQPKKRKYNKR